MSSSKRLIINCGASQLTAAVVAVSEAGLHIEKLVVEDLDYDFSQDNAAMKATGKALKLLAREHKLSGGATLILPGSQILTKAIRIPHVEDAKRAQVTAFEAQQNIPYPLHEVVWDSHVIGDDGVESDLLVIAAKSDAVDDYCGYMSSAGFSLENISAATILNYNSLQFAYPDIDEDVLLINIGSRSTNLLFRNSDGFFVRNIQLGGNSLTQSIADKLGHTFVQAETFKQTCLRGEADSTATDLLTECSESFMHRMNQEITRSILNYRRQCGGVAPTRILLTGRGALLPGLAEHLWAKQKVNVEYFDPLQGVTVDASAGRNLDLLALQLSEIIGEACCEIIPSPVLANLLPEGAKQANAFARKKPILLAAAACMALAPLPVFLALKQENAAHFAYSQQIQAEIAPMESNQLAIVENREQAELASEAIKHVEGLVNSKTNWIQFFAELQQSLHDAKDVWLDQLKVVRERPVGAASSYEVQIEGQMLVRGTDGSLRVDQEALSKRIKGLQSSFEKSKFVVFSKSPVVTWTSLRDGLNVLPFSINLVVDTTKPL